jgi:anti-sigma regulatory factor (Ser/Thr protein kinase)
MAASVILDYRQQSLPVRDPSHSAEARRTATRLVSDAGFDETEIGKVSIIVTELATNLLKHAGQGEILLRPIARGAGDRRRIDRARPRAGHRKSHPMFP